MKDGRKSYDGGFITLISEIGTLEKLQSSPFLMVPEQFMTAAPPVDMTKT